MYGSVLHDVVERTLTEAMHDSNRPFSIASAALYLLASTYHNNISSELFDCKPNILFVTWYTHGYCQ